MKLTKAQRIALLRVKKGIWHPSGSSEWRMTMALQTRGMISSGPGRTHLTPDGEAALAASRGPERNGGMRKCHQCGAARNAVCVEGCIARIARERHERDAIQ